MMSDLKIPPLLIFKAILRLILFIPAMILLLIWPSQNPGWTDAWIFIGFVFTISIITNIWMIRNVPHLFIERMKGTYRGNQRLKDIVISVLLSMIYIAIFPIAATDKRLGVAQLNLPFKLLGWLLFVFSIWLLYIITKINPYLSRAVIILDEHKVITTGIYRIIRHPMYTAIIILTISFCLILGSGLALIPTLISAILIYSRAVFEEELLLDKLVGYVDYKASVTKRFIPYII